MKKGNETGHMVVNIAAGSIAEEVGLAAGDAVLSVNGEPIVDILDYIECLELEELTLQVRKMDGEEWLIEIEKDCGEDLGIEFHHELIEEERACKNKCIFCFIDQLPKGMRQSVYYKDDDWRLSFMMGNYITLTNLSELDVARITKKRISPLYISIHTTNPVLRQRMLNNKRGGEVLQYLHDFQQADIRFFCQIVLCPGWNDGLELDRTMDDLLNFLPALQSIALVPVGLTDHREKLAAITPFTQDLARQVIDQIEKWQHQCILRSGKTLVQLADEFYIMAKRPFPSYDEYEDFPQLENGVGLVVKFQQEFNHAFHEYSLEDKPAYNKVTVVTGVSAQGVLASLTDKVEQRYGVEIMIVPVVNHFFGNKVTVAGLVTGEDIKKTLAGQQLGDVLLIPQAMLRKGHDIFLDNVLVSELEEALGIPIVIVPVDGELFLDALLKKQSEITGSWR